MHTIYVDASVTREQDLAARLGHLVEAGHRVLLIAPKGHPANDLAGPWSSVKATVPAKPPRDSWYLTTDPTTCGDRVTGLQTVLIGPRDTSLRVTRCDSTVRDLREAVLAILADDAMAGQPEG
jgi:hypothetical protein